MHKNGRKKKKGVKTKTKKTSTKKIPKNHSEKSVEEPKYDSMIKELRGHINLKESISMPSVIVSEQLTPTTARKKSALRGKTGTFLLQTHKEGFMNVKRKGKRWRRLWIALTDTTLCCYRDIIVYLSFKFLSENLIKI